MAKLLLVEDDNNLREIYEARLQAEGYTIVSAKDGEEALVVAKAEKPDLVISDVMMPKISGFEMLDILRNTDELKHVKVIMLTALGQSDDQQRADKLGADRYLVKSQVTLEDIIKVTHELLEGEDVPASAVATPAPEPAAPGASGAEPAADTPASEPAAPTEPPAAEPATTDTPDPVPVPEPVADEPVPEPKEEPEKEVADEAAKPAAEEEADVEAKIEDFVAGASSEPTAPDTPGSAAAEPAADTPASEPAAPAEPPAAEPATTDTPDPVPVPEPVAEPVTSPEPVVSEDNKAQAAISDDKLMAEAVEQLVASTDTPDPATDTPASTIVPSAPEVTSPKSIPISVAPEDTEDKPVAPPPEEADTPPAIEADSVVHKKIIKPLENSEKKKDINELLAEEEAKEAQVGVAAGSVVTSSSPTAADEDRASGQAAPSPGSATPPSAKDKGIDPNSIAL
ncbi:MAG TPA: response regulator [Candidatus Saccharimonadales bacterium]|nr:response regulator [Candidatus Saccharimonadales bacterium]